MATQLHDNEALVREFHRRILTEKELDAADELLAADYVEHNPILPGGEIRGRENMVEFWASMFEATPDMSVTEDEVLSAGNTVVTRHTGRGTHDGVFMGLEATGNEVEVSGIDFYHIEDGKIVEGWVALDTLGLMQQLGAVPETPPAQD